MLTRYRRIARSLRDRITSGELPPGSRLPTERQLAADRGVSLPTIRQALEDLQREGLVERRHGIGTFVRSTRPRITYRGDWFGLGPLTQLINLDTQVTASEDVTDESMSMLLRVPSQSVVTRYTYVSKHEGLPYVLANVVIPHVGDFSLPMERLSPWGCDFRDWLARTGVRTDTVERVTARPPTPDEAEVLDTAWGCVLAVERVTTAADGRGLEAAWLVLPGDRTQAIFASHARHVSDSALEGAR